jgi:hypothetical protein
MRGDERYPRTRSRRRRKAGLSSLPARGMTPRFETVSLRLTRRSMQQRRVSPIIRGAYSVIAAPPLTSMSAVPSAPTSSNTKRHFIPHSRFPPPGITVAPPGSGRSPFFSRSGLPSHEISVASRINVYPTRVSHNAWLVDILVARRIVLMLHPSIIIQPACTDLLVRISPD